jgi:hypothetical protein
VLVEPLILDRDEGGADLLWQRPERDIGAPFAPGLADQRAIAAEDERRLRQQDDSPRLCCGREPGCCAPTGRTAATAANARLTDAIATPGWERTLKVKAVTGFLDGRLVKARDL